jgi:hypothetical protein
MDNDANDVCRFYGTRNDGFYVYAGEHNSGAEIGSIITEDSEHEVPYFDNRFAGRKDFKLTLKVMQEITKFMEREPPNYLPNKDGEF